MKRESASKTSRNARKVPAKTVGKATKGNASRKKVAKAGSSPKKTRAAGAKETEKSEKKVARAGTATKRVAKSTPTRTGSGTAPKARTPRVRPGKPPTRPPGKPPGKSNRKPSGGPGSKPAARKAPRSRRVADDATLAGAPVRADLTKAPTKVATSPRLDPEKFRDALRAPIRDSGLPRRIAHGAILPALLSEGRTDQLQAQLDWALEDRVPAYYLAESLLQSYLFVGFPRTINALSRLHEVTRSRRRGLGLSADPLHVPSEIPSLDRILGGPGDFGSALKGRRIRLAEGPPMHLESPGEGPGSFERYAREWWRRGSELCRSVYGSQYLRLRENLGRIHPELADWMVFEGYGKVLSRPVITPRERELWIIPLLMVQNVPDQLYSHIRGAKNLGVPMGRIRAVIWLASAVAGPKAFAEAHQMIAEIERREGEQKQASLRTVY